MENAALHIGLLYESDEWSDHKLASEIERALAMLEPSTPAAVTMINMQDEGCVHAALQCNMLVSRVFASAAFRDHQNSLDHMQMLIDKLASTGIIMLNAPKAHAFEISKQAACDELARTGILTPAIQQAKHPASIDTHAITYPCVIKPDCGGRTTHTTIARDEQQASAFLSNAPGIHFLVQDYIYPERGFITRVEVIDSKPALSVKRSVAVNGLSAYRFGSTYELYDGMPVNLARTVEAAARTLGFAFGSFDIIETERGAFFIDANSVSNVSEDCTEMFGCDLMRLYAESIARQALEHTTNRQNAQPVKS